MAFIKVLEVNITGLSENNFLYLEEIMVEKFPDFIAEKSSNSLIIFKNEFMDNDSISMNDYIIPGKIVKNFLIENKFCDEKNYKNLFSLEKKEIPEKLENIDNLIAKVPENDEKLNHALEFINKIKKAK